MTPQKRGGAGRGAGPHARASGKFAFNYNSPLGGRTRLLRPNGRAISSAPQDSFVPMAAQMAPWVLADGADPNKHPGEDPASSRQALLDGMVVDYAFDCTSAGACLSRRLGPLLRRALVCLRRPRTCRLKSFGASEVVFVGIPYLS